MILRGGVKRRSMAPNRIHRGHFGYKIEKRDMKRIKMILSAIHSTQLLGHLEVLRCFSYLHQVYYVI